MWFCKHQWEIKVEKTTESKFEHAMSQIPKDRSSSKIPHQMCCAERKNIIILACSKCGKLHTTITKI